MRAQRRHGPAAAGQGLRVALLARLPDHAVAPFRDLWVRLKVGADELFRLVTRDTFALREAKGGQPVEHAEVEDLRAPPLLGIDRVGRDAEDARRRCRVDVEPFVESLLQGLVAREVCEDAQLDLRVVDGKEEWVFAAVARHEGAAHVVPHCRTHRNVLKVRVVGGKPPRRRRHLRIDGVHPVGAWIHLAGERVDVGGLQLR